MSIPTELLRCPITQQPLSPASDDVIRKVREAHEAGMLRNRSGAAIAAPASGLVTTDGRWFYPIFSGIPAMLANEAVALPELRGPSGAEDES